VVLQGPSVRPRARTQLRLNIRFNSSSFCSACSRVQGQVAKNWLREGTLDRTEGAGMLELDRRLKGRIRARTTVRATHTRARGPFQQRFMQIPYASSTLRYAALLVFRPKYC